MAHAEKLFDVFAEEVATNYLELCGQGFDWWLAKWPKQKRKAILESMDRDHIRPDRVKAMVKIECCHDEPTRSRLIQFYFNLATQAVYGLEFTCFQKSLCNTFRNLQVSEKIDVTIASGMNADDLSEWMNVRVARGACYFYERDCKSYDATMQKMHRLFKTRFIRKIDDKLAAFIDDCSTVKGLGVFREGLFVYKVAETVQSGHNDTTSGNGLVNAGITVEAFSSCGLECSILIAGDDCLVAVYSDFDADLIAKIESELGVIPVARKLSSPADVSFISGIWLMNGKKWQFVPKLGRILARLWWTVNPPGKRTRSAYIRGVARGLLPSCGNLPIVRQFLLKFDSDGEALMTNRYWEYRVKPIEWDGSIRRHLLDRYGITESELSECESFLARLPAEPLLIVHPVLDRIMAVDLADLVDRPICEI